MGLMGVLHRWGTLFFTMKEELGITARQIDEIQQVLISHAKFAIPKLAQRQVLVMEVQEQLTSDSPDWQGIEQKIRELGTLDAEMNTEGVRTLGKAMAALGPEQRSRMKELFRASAFSWMLGTQGPSGESGHEHAGGPGHGGADPGLDGGASLKEDGEDATDAQDRHDHSG
jgi:Spy/CpxP family protein refolding chaperone